MEFAKRIVTPRGEFTPLGANNIINCLRNKGNIVTLFTDYIGKGGNLIWANVVKQLTQLSHRSDILSFRSKDVLPLTWSLVAPFGPINVPEIVPVRATTLLGVDSPDVVIAAFQSSLAISHRDEAVRVLAKARQTYNEVINSIMDFGPKLSIGKTPDVSLVSYSMLRSSYNKALSELENLHQLDSDIFRPFGVDPSLLNSEDLESVLVPYLKEAISNNTLLPLDNPFVRPRVVHPRLEDKFIGLAKGAIKYVKHTPPVEQEVYMDFDQWQSATGGSLDDLF
jgi:hypothetical protein